MEIEDMGFIFIVVSALIYLGTMTTGMREPGRTFILLVAACFAFAGVVLVIIWTLDLFVRQYASFQQIKHQAEYDMMRTIARMNREQIEFTKYMLTWKALHPGEPMPENGEPISEYLQKYMREN